MSIEAGAGARNKKGDPKPPVGDHAWQRIVKGRAAGWQGQAGRGEVDALPKREKTPKAKEPEPTTTTETPQGDPYRERTLTVAEQLEKKLKQLKAKVHNNEIHADLMAAEQLFEDLKKAHTDEEVAAYDQKLKITEGLEVARHLANIYNQLEVWKADPEQQAHPSDDAKDPAGLHQKAELSLQESREFSKKYEAALKHLDEVYHGRSDEKDEEAQETKGLEGDDLTLPYEKRLGFLETKVRERLKTATGREATQEEFDRVVYNVNGTPSPLSKPKRVGQFLKRLGESTLGKVFDTFADTSIQEAVSQYRALENQGIKASETVQELMAEKARREAYAQQLQEQIKNLEKIRTAREAREARQKAIEKMKPEPLANGEILAKEEVLEKKRRILARNKFEIEERDQKEKHKAEIAAAERVGDKAKVKGLKARKDYTANDLERDEAATEAFDAARLETAVNKRIQEWRNTQRVLKSFGEDFIDPNSKEGKTQEEEIRDQVITETRKNRADILANKGREGEEDLFFGKEDALGERREKREAQTSAEEITNEPAKKKKEPINKPRKTEVLSDSGRYTLEGADIPYPEKPITLGDLPEKQEAARGYRLDKGIHPKEEMSFVMGEEPAVNEVPFKLNPAELALHSSSEPLTEKALQREAKGVLEKITREAKKLPSTASEFSVAKSIRDELQKYPIDWAAKHLRSVMDELHRQEQTYQDQIDHGTINETIKNELKRWVKINRHLIDLSQKTDAEQETYLTKIYDSSLKPELTIRQKGGLQKGEERQEQEESERQKRQERKRRSEIMSQLLQELKDASNWRENDVKALAEGMLESMQQQGFSTEEIKGSLEEFSKNETSSWKEQREKQTGRVQKGARNKLLMMAELDSLLQPKGPEDSKSGRGGAEQPPISTKATDTERSSQRKVEEPTGYPSQETLDEDIADEEIEAFLEDSLLKEGLNIITLKTKIKESIQKAQETSPKEWQNTETLLRASILFKKEGSTQLTPEKIAKKYLDFLCLYRLAKMQEQKADVTLIQKQVINSLSPRIGVPTAAIDKWAKQPVPMELVPESIAQKLSTYKEKPTQKATS